MKNKYMLIILASTVLGLFIGSVIRDYNNKDFVYVSKDKVVKKEIKMKEKSVKKLRKESDNLEDKLYKLQKENESTDKLNKIESLKNEISYTDAKGYGMIITIDELNSQIGNIANFVEANKILINIINELKSNEIKYISINNQRINQYTSMILAGNHININSVPVAPPYEIQCIGSKEVVNNYIRNGSLYLDSIQSNNPIKLKIKASKNITMNKISTPNKLKYIKGE